MPGQHLLDAVLAQRLVRRLCPACRVAEHLVGRQLGMTHCRVYALHVRAPSAAGRGG